MTKLLGGDQVVLGMGLTAEVVDAGGEFVLCVGEKWGDLLGVTV